VKLSLVDTLSGKCSVHGSVDRIGSKDEEGTRRIRHEDGPEQAENALTADHREALEWLASALGADPDPEAVGHRVVHGGERHVSPVVVDEDVLDDLESLSPLAPLHNPPNLAGIRVARELFPALSQVAVFDTAFHATLPDYAYRYAIPEALYQRYGIRRYGFHGLSHRYVSERAAVLLGRADLRLVTLHLGNGCSGAAVRGGRSVDTSMGMTPLEGLVMGTRCGDLDPAVPLMLQAEGALSAAQVDRLLNRESGLVALSGGEQDMRDIQARMEAGDGPARLAFEAFCYRVRKYVGAYAAVLGGLDALVFTAGIGENSAPVRAAVCSGLEFLGIRLNPALNGEKSAEERDLGDEGSSARVLVIPTNEELVIARETEAALRAGR
jgi:acetate kinase